MNVKDTILNYLEEHPTASYLELIKACSDCKVDNLYSAVNVILSYLLNKNLVTRISGDPELYSLKK